MANQYSVLSKVVAEKEGEMVGIITPTPEKEGRLLGVRSPVKEFEPCEPVMDFIEPPTVVASPRRGTSGQEFGLPLGTMPTCVFLNVEDLKCFEVVEHQFEHWGIIFRNAIALHPTNPAFPPRSGNTVLMAAPKNGLLEISFLHPARFFSCYITSSQRTILSAYDSEEKLLVRTEMPMANLAGSGSEIPPNIQLSLSTPNIYRVSLYSFDGHLTIDDLSFGF